MVPNTEIVEAMSVDDARYITDRIKVGVEAITLFGFVAVALRGTNQSRGNNA
jgi:hypothetical protein